MSETESTLEEIQAQKAVYERQLEIIDKAKSFAIIAYSPDGPDHDKKIGDGIPLGTVSGYLRRMLSFCIERCEVLEHAWYMEHVPHRQTALDALARINSGEAEPSDFELVQQYLKWHK